MSYVLKNKLLGDQSNTTYKYINSYLDQHKKEKEIKRKIINREFLKCCNIATEGAEFPRTRSGIDRDGVEWGELPLDLIWDMFIQDLIWEILYYRFKIARYRFQYPRAWRSRSGPTRSIYGEWNGKNN